MGFVAKRLNPRILPLYGVALLLLFLARPLPATLAAGLVPLAAGVGLRLWAAGYLHKTDALTTAGPYAYLRHPLYLGSLLVALGFVVMAHQPGTWAVFALLATGFFAYYLPYKDRVESARLERLYGDAFRRYAAAVPRLLPRFVAYRPLPAEATGAQRWESARFADNHEWGLALAAGLGALAMVTRWMLR